MPARNPHRVSLALTALAAAVLIGVAWLTSRGDTLPPQAALGSVGTVVGTDMTNAPGEVVSEADLVAETVSPARQAAAARSPEEPMAGALHTSPTSASSRTAAPVGKLVVRAVDGATALSLPAPRVRAASSTRFAELVRRADAVETVLRLTPGNYDLFVASPGFEPVELPNVRVLATEVTTLPPVRLRPGSSRILGFADGARPGEALRAELHGEGRLACGDCRGDPCTRCGYAADRSSLALQTDGWFGFERLASGTYLLRLVDEHAREASTPIRIDLAAAESRQVEISLTRTRSVRLALVDADGTPLDRVWAARIAAHPDDPDKSLPDVVFESGDGIKWECRFLQRDELVALGELYPPAPEGPRPGFGTGVGCGLFCGSSDRDDRGRRAEDALRPVPAVPSIGPTRLGPVVEPSGLVHIDDVPARAEVLEMRCGPFVAVMTLGHAGESVLRVRVVLDRDRVQDHETTTFLEYEAAAGG